MNINFSAAQPRVQSSLNQPKFGDWVRNLPNESLYVQNTPDKTFTVALDANTIDLLSTAIANKSVQANADYWTKTQ